MMLTDLDRTLRDADLRVAEVPGWRTRGHGQMNAVKTITCHHTANGGASGNAPSLPVVRDGRPGLKGPLSQLFLAKDGTWFIVAAGVAWHAGVSLESRFGNLWALGIEAEAVGVPGTKGDWPEVQMASYARGVAALRKRYDLGLDDVRGHKETAAPRGRKTDPSFDMAAFRRRVGAVDLTTNGDDVITDTDIQKIAQAVARYPIANKNPAPAPDAAPSSLAGSVVDIERTQDGHTTKLDGHTTELRDIKLELREVTAGLEEVRKIADQQAQLITALITKLQG